jgi:hypothetical protein
MGCCICNIEQLANGYELSLRDPTKVKKNEGKNASWEDPMVSYAFPDLDKMIDFLRTNLPKAAEGDDEYSATFGKAAKE